jgi:hypothetical protein
VKPAQKIYLASLNEFFSIAAFWNQFVIRDKEQLYGKLNNLAAVTFYE